MPDHQPLPPPTTGLVPDAFLAALRFHWAPAMPTPLRRSRFLAVLYAAHRLADTSGTLRDTTGCTLPLTAIARCAATSEPDAARYLAAALSSSVIVYRHPDHLVLAPAATPDWQAAVDVIDHYAPAGIPA